MSRKPQGVFQSRRIALAAAAAVAICVIPAALFWAFSSRATLEPWFGQWDPSAREAYDFSLTDQDGKPVRLRDLRGSAVLLSFGFTRCPNICPTTLGHLASVYRKLSPAARERTRVVFVSVDERDSPQSLKEYVPFFHERFIGLTGSPAEIGTTARAYGAFFRKAPAVGSDPNDYMIDHSTYAYLIDPTGKMRVLYRFEQLPETEKIARDLERVLAAGVAPASVRQQ